MPSPIFSSLAQQIKELEAAVIAGDRTRAHALAHIILQRFAREVAAGLSVEIQVRALLAGLAIPPPQVDAALPDIVPGERGTPSPKREPGFVYPVWFGTNRKPTADGKAFTNERHRFTTLGCAHVHVPEAHRFAETGSSFWQRLRRLDFRDDRLRLARVQSRDRTAFFAELQNTMNTMKADSSVAHALLFIHGYNTTFEDAAIRAAQIGVDLKVLGATAFFSWPSRGSVAAYPVDEATIDASESAITAFLVDFAANCGADIVHVIAHSMGNRGFLRALQRIAARADTRGTIKFGQIFLAAPDIDRDLFLDLAHLYPEYSERTTLYSSDADCAVQVSAWLHDAPRAGYFKPYTVAAGLDTVAVPDFNVELLGHSYFAQAEALLHDIYDLIRHSEDPVRRQRVAPAFHDGIAFWKLRR